MNKKLLIVDDFTEFNVIKYKATLYAIKDGTYTFSTSLMISHDADIKIEYILKQLVHRIEYKLKSEEIHDIEIGSVYFKNKTYSLEDIGLKNKEKQEDQYYKNIGINKYQEDTRPII